MALVEQDARIQGASRARRLAAPAAARRWSWTRAARALCLGILLLPALVTYRPAASEAQVRTAAQPHAFDLVGWEAAQLRARLPSLLDRLRQPPAAEAALAPPEARAAVQAYFTAGQRWRQAVARRAPAEELEPLRAAWLATQEPAARAIAESLAVLARREGLTTITPLGDWLLPPASFVLTDPPRVLVVSPRDRIEAVQSVLLRPDVSTTDAEALEAEVEALGLSALVVQIGGIATYPAIVPFQGRPQDMLSAIAHEWTHGWLIFHPLGRAWFASYDGRTLNETVADLVGRELGARLAEAYDLDAPAQEPDRAATPARSPAFDFRAEMRATRAHLDALLARGDLDEAARYLAERRQVFVAAGYPIRKLNQAYFAFHGSYAESGAVVSPLETDVRALRDRSPSLGAFLHQVAPMTSAGDVAAALARPPDS